MRLLHTELLKIRTTSMAWIMLALGVLMWIPALLVARHNVSAIGLADPSTETNLSAESAAQDLYTAGTVPSLILVMLLGVLVMTGEFQHRTATLTFLAHPHRVSVVLAKTATVALLGICWSLLLLVLNLLVGVLPLRERLGGLWLADPDTVGSVLVSMLGYPLWAAIGIGFGVLVRSQVVAVIIALAVTFGGTIAMLVVFALSQYLGAWVEDAVIGFPTVATLVMISGSAPGEPPAWVGAAVLAGWGVLTAALGSVRMNRRDIT
ncbi:ABC transporter permease [Pilimelia columellifera]|uniref:ABC transporter permease n=1 Tax=Pilimelia columellifera subsp. columellifera TaxID=706583 RepID=A0ABN3NIT2_9ACTN